VIATRVGVMPVGFRIWPWHHPPPADGLSGPTVGGPHLEPAPGIEEALGHQLHVESNDPQALGRLLDADVLAPILAAGDSGSASFAGLTYDGEFLMIHLAGPMAGDPQRGTHLARLLWEPWTP
ncbi:MAG: hypothetical protein VX938_00195, partial [Myxococcota bacterium]|nr:hypothetical protein [Myxococcota bacterium]